MKFNRFFAAMAAVCFTPAVFGQVLPNYMTEQEKLIYPAYLQNIISKGFTTPPFSPVRSAAEWEESDGMVISWQGYNSVLTEIVRHARNECLVYIVCSDSTSVKNYLNNNGVTPDPARIKYVVASSNSVWIRDYGPNVVYTHDVDSLLYVDWVYNRPRPQDDIIPSVMATKIGVPLYQTTVNPWRLVATGGNFMSDGFGTAFSSKLILDENSLTVAQIDTIVKRFMGIKRYIKMNNLPYDGIHHIDMHMKLLNEETLLVGQYPNGVADGPQIESNLNYVINNFNSLFGTQYKVVRIPMPPDNGQYPDGYGDYWTYTNSLIVNKTVLVPTYNCPYDTTALRIYRQAMPGYNVVGINSLITIPASGAIHCITHELGTKNPLLISHQSYSNRKSTDGYHLYARILHRSGIVWAKIHYAVNDGTFSEVLMNCTDSSNHVWEGIIPNSRESVDIKYYFEAMSNSGKTQVRPITAPDGYFSFPAEIINHIPVANAGYDMNVFENETVTLNGSLSSDADADSLLFSWHAPDGVVLSDTSAVMPTFIAPETDDSLQLTFILKVNDGFEWSEPDTMIVMVKNITGIHHHLLQKSVNIFPNPAKDAFYIEGYTHETGMIEIAISNIQGNTIYKSTFTAGNRFQYLVNQKLTPGLYFVKITSGTETVTKKLIIR